MERIEAVFADGVFKPLSGVSLPENQRVRIGVEPISATDPMDWFRGVQEHHRRLLEQHGPFPDSTIDIAEDRERDV
jgi:predicted DNA-binding antitoxin AbrB/MazE fold protein